jgi:hypothetical protein
MQLKLDFNGKLEHPVTFKATEDLKSMLSSVAKDLNQDVSELVREYVTECVFRDKGKIELLKGRGQSVFVNMIRS